MSLFSAPKFSDSRRNGDEDTTFSLVPTTQEVGRRGNNPQPASQMGNPGFLFTTGSNSFTGSNLPPSGQNNYTFQFQAGGRPPSARHIATPRNSRGRQMAVAQQGAEAFPRLGSESLNLSSIANAVDDVVLDVPAQRPRPSNLLPPTPSNGGISNSERSRSGSRLGQTIYEVAEEDPPLDRFHEPSIQQGLENAQSAMSSLKDVLGRGGLHVELDHMRRLHSKAEELSEFSCRSITTVAFVGDSGVGKSSLLNALLDYKAFGKTGSSGAACTCAVTEYHYHEDQNFAIEVEALSIDQLYTQISNMVELYRLFHCHRSSVADDGLRAAEANATLASDLFVAMFQGRSADHDFLVTRPAAAVIQQLSIWAGDFASNLSRERQTASTATECAALLTRLTSASPQMNDQPAIWPYIHKIKVFSNAHILSKGLVLTDLPGLRDSNSARVRQTEEYIRSCDKIFVVSNINRAVSNDGVRTIVNLAQRANLSPVGIICTKSENVDADELKSEWGYDLSRSIDGLQDAIDEIQTTLDEIVHQIENHDEVDLEPDEKVHLNELKVKQSDWSKKKEMCQFALNKFLIQTRNGKVSMALGEAYGGETRVFCTSSTSYWIQRKKSRNISLPFIELSGIPALRRHCISLVAESKRLAAIKFMSSEIPALLSDVKLWVESGSGSLDAERILTLRKDLDTIEDRLTRTLTSRTSGPCTIASNIKDSFKGNIYQPAQLRRWTLSAVDASCAWEDWAPPTYIAFCRNFGTHRTDAVGERCWNEEAMEAMVTDLETPFSDLCASMTDRMDSIIRSVNNVVDWSIGLLDNDAERSNGSVAALITVLEKRQDLLVKDIEKEFHSFDIVLRALRTDALSGIPTSFFGKAMERAYKDCNKTYGNKSDRKRKDIIQRALGQNNLFGDVMGLFKTKFEERAQEFQELLREKLQEHLDEISHSLNLIRSENAVSESESNSAFRETVESQLGETLIVMAQVQARLDGA